MHWWRVWDVQGVMHFVNLSEVVSIAIKDNEDPASPVKLVLPDGSVLELGENENRVAMIEELVLLSSRPDRDAVNRRQEKQAMQASPQDGVNGDFEVANAVRNGLRELGGRLDPDLEKEKIARYLFGLLSDIASMEQNTMYTDRQFRTEARRKASSRLDVAREYQGTPTWSMRARWLSG